MKKLLLSLSFFLTTAIANAQWGIGLSPGITVPFGELSDQFKNYSFLRLESHYNIQNFQFGIQSGIGIGIGQSISESYEILITQVTINRAYSGMYVPALAFAKFAYPVQGYSPYIKVGFGIHYFKTITKEEQSGLDIPFIDQIIGQPLTLVAPENKETLTEEYPINIMPEIGVDFTINQRVKCNVFTNFSLNGDYPFMNFGVGFSVLFGKTQENPANIDYTR
jgi:hypothetical protein